MNCYPKSIYNRIAHNQCSNNNPYQTPNDVINGRITDKYPQPQNVQRIGKGYEQNTNIYSYGQPIHPVYHQPHYQSHHSINPPNYNMMTGHQPRHNSFDDDYRRHNDNRCV